MTLTPEPLTQRLMITMSMKPFSFRPDLEPPALLDHIESGTACRPAQVALARQVHSAWASCVEPSASTLAQRCPDTDALVTRAPGLALAVTTADCTAIAVYDPSHHALGLIHAGWRGTLGGVIASTLSLMEELFHTSPSSCWAIMAPSIGVCCYEVGADVQRLFLESYGDAITPMFTAPVGAPKAHMNLKAIQRHILMDHGIPGDQCLGSDLCTSCRPDQFFSYRRDKGLVGRHLTLAVLL